METCYQRDRERGNQHRDAEQLAQKKACDRRQKEEGAQPSSKADAFELDVHLSGTSRARLREEPALRLPLGGEELDGVAAMGAGTTQHVANFSTACYASLAMEHRELC